MHFRLHWPRRCWDLSKVQGLVVVSPWEPMEVRKVLLALYGSGEFLITPLHHAPKHLTKASQAMSATKHRQRHAFTDVGLHGHRVALIPARQGPLGNCVSLLLSVLPPLSACRGASPSCCGPLGLGRRSHAPPAHGGPAGVQSAAGARKMRTPRHAHHTCKQP